MRFHASVALIAAAGLTVGCDSSTPVQPSLANSASLTPSAAAAAAVGKPEVDPTYANGKTVYMIRPRLILNARTTMPNAYAHAEELYMVVYPQMTTPAPGAGPITLPSGYQPQCNPCFSPGLLPAFVYHDHVITGDPGMGNQGTAGEYEAPWKIIVLVYDPAYAASPTFTPVTSEAGIDAAEQAGGVFKQINQGGANPYEKEPGNLLICPTVSSHA